MFSGTKRPSSSKKVGKSKKAKHTSLTTADASPEAATSTPVTIANMTDLTPTVPASAVIESAQVNQASGFTVSI
jgi:hypothetical protein